MPTLHRYHVVPKVPKTLERLRELAQNLWWTWNPEGRELFARIDPDLFEAVHGNPIELLSRVGQKRLDELSEDDAFTSHLEECSTLFSKYLAREGWWNRTFPAAKDAVIAYFSMEYGLHESLPIYSGGLGVLAGDHLKTASDLGLPLVAIGLAYAEGYFRQVLNEDGWQGERYPLNDWRRLPVQPVFVNGPKGEERLKIRVEYPDRIVVAQLWKVAVGRVPLYLLDANLEENAPEDRAITGPLYGGDQEFRVRQEIMLGIGGVHALAAVGLTPTVCHMNEGHSAFLALERIRRVMSDKGVSFAVASEAMSAGNIFTTHTPVPAGNDAFDPALVRRYLEPYRRAIGLSEQELLALGRATEGPGSEKERFSMPVLAIRTADRYNGVSALHGEVSRKMYRPLWPELPEHEVPISSVTNGVHIPSWLSDEMAALFSRYLGPRWLDSADDPALWARAAQIPDGELWQTHEHRKQRLVTLARRWLHTAAEKRSEGAQELAFTDEALDPRALTIGFARRFATYKRAALLFSDLERVKRLLGDVERPVQLVFAGKAHPQDKGGKELIRQIVHSSRDLGLRGKVVFIEDYDMRIARAIVSGVDVWLNTPRRPHEASGTSGMKAAANGALNLSVLDGWWAEAWASHGREVGWAIGRGEEYADGEGDSVEAEELYDVLEREVVPLYYDRDGRDKLPRQWIRRMKGAISHCVPMFNTARMVKEYATRFYVPAVELTTKMNDKNLAGATALTAWKDRVRGAWSDVRVLDVVLQTPEEVKVGEKLSVEAKVRLGSLAPDDVAVELYYGPTHGGLELTAGEIVRLRVIDGQDGVYRFRGEIGTDTSGSHAFAARVVPYNPTMSHPYETSLIRWG